MDTTQCTFLNISSGVQVGNNDVPHMTVGQPQIAMFSGLRNVSISGGTFVMQNNINTDRYGLRLLREHVATSAFHNSAQHIDPPRCHPRTRIEILQRIYDWIVQSEERESWVLWLNGAAGAGKSAIMQSIVERCAQAALAIASFFFFRVDSTRNVVAPVVATLAYQLIQVIPETSDDILSIIERNPLIFDQSLESQLQQLLIQPLLHLPRHLQRLFVVFIDGLDECNDRNQQSTLIKLLGAVSRVQNGPILFVVASRREPQIEAGFLHEQFSGLLCTLALDNSDIERTSDDIHRFLTDKFKEIKRSHLRRHLLPIDWPPTSAVEEIVTKSSGQFIYASVVIDHIQSPRANPARQLDVIRGIRLQDPSSHNPFAHLDALYKHIFSQVETLDKVLDILAYALITGHYQISELQTIFLLEDGELEIYLADLAAVVECNLHPQYHTTIRFLHASLPDFLRDKTRSGYYHIDVDEYRTKLLCMLLTRISPTEDLLPQTHLWIGASVKEYERLYAIDRLLDSRLLVIDNQLKVSDQLQLSIMNFNFDFNTLGKNKVSVIAMIAILTSLKDLDLYDGGQAYSHVLDMFAVGFAKLWQSLGDDQGHMERHSPDLLARIRQILEEGAKV